MTPEIDGIGKTYLIGADTTGDGEKKRRYAMGPNGHSLAVNRNLAELDDAVDAWLQDAEDGDEFTIRVVALTDKEYDALPDYTGP